MQDQPVILSDDLSVAYLQGPGIIVSETDDLAAKKATTPYLKPEGNNGRWAYWGVDDDRPGTIIEKVEQNVVASAGLEWLARAFYGNGIMTYKIKYDEKNKEIIIPVRDSVVQEFFARTNIEQYLEESIYDYVYFKNIFPEMLLGRERYKDKIVKISAKEASFSRWGVMNEKTRKITQFYYSSEFPQTTDDYIDVIPVFDPKNPLKNAKFIYRVRFASIGRRYYAKPAWHSIIDSGWIDISNDIPTLKKSLLKNAMTIRYHIHIPKSYWADKYKNWTKMAPEEQKKLREAEFKNMNDLLTGKENVMKTFFSHYGIDKITGKEIPGWKIEKIDNAVPDGKMVTEDVQANAMILFALNLDPTLIGASLPNTKESSGSGSDKREAFTIFNALLNMTRKRFLAPLYFIKQFNGWDPELEFGFKNVELTTLDKNPTGQQKVIAE